MRRPPRTSTTPITRGYKPFLSRRNYEPAPHDTVRDTIPSFHRLSRRRRPQRSPRHTVRDTIPPFHRQPPRRRPSGNSSRPPHKYLTEAALDQRSRHYCSPYEYLGPPCLPIQFANTGTPTPFLNPAVQHTYFWVQATDGHSAFRDDDQPTDDTFQRRFSGAQATPLPSTPPMSCPPRWATRRPIFHPSVFIFPATYSLTWNFLSPVNTRQVPLLFHCSVFLFRSLRTH